MSEEAQEAKPKEFAEKWVKPQATQLLLSA